LQSLQIHDLYNLLGPNARPLLDQIEELKTLKSQYEQTVQEARTKENNIAELYRVNASNLEQIQYENTRRQQELQEMKAALDLRAATAEQRELQLQERIANVELREAQLKQHENNLAGQQSYFDNTRAVLDARARALVDRETKVTKLIEDLKGYLCQLT
jgi:chromosome segregation ATPase